MKDKKILSYIERAKVIAKNSPDEETQVGSVLVSKSTESVISEGFNGFVRGGPDEKLPKTRPEKYKYMIHAEENLLTNACRNGVRTENCFVVQTISPCIRCARLLYQAGIDTVYFEGWYDQSCLIEELGDLKLKFTKFDKYTKIEITANKG